MSTPQPPDQGQAGPTGEEPASTKPRVEPPPPDTGPEGPIPEANLPGHHPEVEQDKPTGPPPRPKRAASKAAERKGAAAGRATRGPAAKAKKATPATKSRKSVATKATTKASPLGTVGSMARRSGRSVVPTAAKASSTLKAVPEPSAELGAIPISGRMRFPFAFEPRVLPFAAAFGVLPFTTGVELTADKLRVRFGLWSLTTDLDNIADAEVTGPYRLWRVAGPAHLSLADGGITFATNTRAGACLTFREPVPAALPVPMLRHASATITVAEPEELVEAIRNRVKT